MVQQQLEMDSAALYVMVFTVIIGVTLVAIAFNRKPLGRRNLPPGPRGLPVVGMLFKMRNHPHIFLAKMAQKYGPVMYLKLGQKDCVVASTPAAAKEFLKHQDANFSARPYVTHAEIIYYSTQGIAWQSNTQGWKHMRKLFLGKLTSAKRMEALKQVRTEEVLAMLRTINEAPEGVLKIKNHLSTMASNIISRMILNKRYEAGVHEFQALNDEVSVLTGSYSIIGDFIPAFKWVDFQGYKQRLRAVHKRLDVFVSQILAEHRARRQGAGFIMPKWENDMVNVLLDEIESNNAAEYQLSEENVKCIILEAFIAANDTTIVTIEWAISEVIRSPAIMQKAWMELDSVVGRTRMVQESDLPQLKYIQMIVKETFRLHATGPLLIPHESIESCKAFGYDIPAKCRLLVNVHAIGRDGNTWDNPLEFIPDRFMETKHANIDVCGHDYALLPFGSGRRMCPAMPMGYLVVQFAVAALIHSFHWSLPGQMDPRNMDMSDGKGLAVPRAVPLQAVAKPRLPLPLYN